jgi:hypothetical protein
MKNEHMISEDAVGICPKCGPLGPSDIDQETVGKPCYWCGSTVDRRPEFIRLNIRAREYAQQGFDAPTATFLAKAYEDLELYCRYANKCMVHPSGVDGNYHHWSDRAQNLRRVLVDHGVLPSTAL